MNKDLEYYKNNCEEDYMTTPISVLRYITELEEVLTTPLSPSKSDGQRYGLSDRLFTLANDFAIAKEGDIAVRLHSIYNNYTPAQEPKGSEEIIIAREELDQAINEAIDDVEKSRTDQEPKGSEEGGEQQSEYDNIEAIEMSRNKKKNNP